MYRSIQAAAHRFCEKNGSIPIIHCNEVIQALRQEAPFDRRNGGQSLCRDGFHAHLLYGRYALAATWYETLCKGDIRENAFFPTVADIKNGYAFPADHQTDSRLIDTIKTVVHKICS